jgi:regulator of replication initiation timing
MVSTKLMPKKEKKEADAVFIDTLMDRISVLEGRIDQQTIAIKELVKENERLKVELEYIKKEKNK